MIRICEGIEIIGTFFEDELVKYIPSDIFIQLKCQAKAKTKRNFGIFC